MRGFRNAIIASVAGALLLGCTGQSKPEYRSESDPDTNIAAFRTFGWKPAAGDDAPTSLMDTHIRNAIRDELVRRGYTQTDDSPDLLVNYEFVAQDKIKSNPFQIGIGMGSWGGSGGAGVNVGSSSVKAYTEGRLVIHVLYREANQEVWMGTVSDALKEGQLNAEGAARAVALAMQDFPTQENAPKPAPEAATPESSPGT